MNQTAKNKAGKPKQKQKGFISGSSAPEQKISMRVVEESGKPIQATFNRTKTSPFGLFNHDAAERLQRSGPNEVAHDKAPHALVQMALSFKNPFVIVLLILASISYILDVHLAEPDERSWKGVIILLTMVTISSLLRFFQEYRSNKAAERLKSMVRTTATVLRRSNDAANPQRQEIPMRELVVGDIVSLQAGDMIPADIRLFASRDLFISQAVLTGEALPVEKYDTLGAVAQKSADANPADRKSVV